MKLEVYRAEFSMVTEQKEGYPPKIKNCGSVRFILLEGYEGSIAGMAYKRANREQLECSKVHIVRES